MIRHFFFLLLVLFSPFLGAQEGEPPPQEREAIPYPTADERFLEELRKQDQEQEEVGETRFFQEFLYMLFILGMIVAALFLISWAIKRMMHSRIEQMNLTNLIKVLERRDLSQRSALYLIEVNGKGALIAESSQGVTSLGDVDLSSAQSTFEELMEE